MIHIFWLSSLTNCSVALFLTIALHCAFCNGLSPICMFRLSTCRDSNNFGCVDSVELFADQLLEITTQVLRADDNGRSMQPSVRASVKCWAAISAGSCVAMLLQPRVGLLHRYLQPLALIVYKYSSGGIICKTCGWQIADPRNESCLKVMGRGQNSGIFYVGPKI